MLWRLYHIQQGIETASEDIKSKNKELVMLRKEHVRSRRPLALASRVADSFSFLGIQDAHEKKVSTARKAQVALQAEISKQERVIKNKEKAADQQVRLCCPPVPSLA